MRPNFTVFLMQDKLINVLYFPHFEGHDTVQLYVHHDFTEKKVVRKKADISIGVHKGAF